MVIYKEDFRNYKSLLIILLVFEFFGSALFYYSNYRSNKYNFYQPEQQERERMKIDSINKSEELESEILKLSSVKKESENAYLEMRYLSRIINILTSGDKLNDTISIEHTNSYVTLNNIHEHVKERDTLFTVHKFIDSVMTLQYVKLKLNYYGWGKYPFNKENNSSDKLIDKLRSQEKKTRELLEETKKSIFQYKERISYLTEELKYIRNGSSLNLIDFVIFSGNLHTSLGFNGIIPASSRMRLWCLINKVIILIIYYFIYKKFKRKG